MSLWLVITFIILSILIVIGGRVFTFTHDSLRIPGIGGCVTRITLFLLLALLLSILAFWLSSGR